MQWYINKYYISNMSNLFSCCFQVYIAFGVYIYACFIYIYIYIYCMYCIGIYLEFNEYSDVDTLLLLS